MTVLIPHNIIIVHGKSNSYVLLLFIDVVKQNNNGCYKA